MACRLKITNPALKRALGYPESSEVSFDTYTAFTSHVKVGTELLVSDKHGDFIARFRGLTFSLSDSLGVSYDSEFGRGTTAIEDVKGHVTDELLRANIQTLNALSRARIIDPVPTTVEVVDDPSDAAGNSGTSNTVDYDEDNSKIKIEQYESTTGQDVKSERDGTLDERPSTLAKMVLREAVAQNPNKYEFFIVADSPSYFIEEGASPTGEVLLVVHAAAHKSLTAELGRPLTQTELEQVAVRINNNVISAEGEIYTLPLEGSLQEGADTFFNRNHDDRVAAYATKYDTTLDEADEHFRAGQRNLRAARSRARTAPVPVKVTSVSMGSTTGEPMSVRDFEDKYDVVDVTFEKNLNRAGVVGRVYLYGTSNGKPVRMLLVPVNLVDKYGFDNLWAKASTNPVDNPVDWQFLESIFGTNRRKAGPYVRKGVLMSKGVPITTEEQFREALNDNNWPALSDKVKEGTSVLDNGKTVSNQDFIREHTKTDGGLWTHRGLPVPYAANRYFYIDISQPTKASERVSDQKDSVARAANALFADPQEYFRIAASQEAPDMAIKAMLPRLFTTQFELSESFKRLVAGQKAINQSNTETYAVNTPVGARYFGSKSVSSRKLKPLLVNYLKGDLFRLRAVKRADQKRGTESTASFPSTGLFLPAETRSGLDFLIFYNISDEEINRIAEELSEGLFTAFKNYVDKQVVLEMERLKSDGITDVNDLGIPTKESLAQTLFTVYANQYVAQTETEIMYGEGDSLFGVSPETLPEYWNSQKEGPSITEALTGTPYTPNTGVRSLQGNKGYMTLDTYRTWSLAAGTWTEEQEAAYQNEVKFASGASLSATSLMGETVIKLSYSGPMNTAMRSGAQEEDFVPGFVEITEFDQEFTVLIPSKVMGTGSDEEQIHRQLLEANAQITLERETRLQLTYFVQVREKSTNTVEDELRQLESVQPDVNEFLNTEIYQYAEAVLGKSFASRLFSTGKTLTFADIDGYAAQVGNANFTFTKYSTPKEFAISPKSAALIAEGKKTLTLRQRGEDYSGANRSGLVEIDGEVFDIQELGEMNLEQALKATRMTAQQFAQAFMGESGSIEDIFIPDVKAFFEGSSKRRVYTIKPVGKPKKTAKPRGKKATMKGKILGTVIGQPTDLLGGVKEAWMDMFDPAKYDLDTAMQKLNPPKGQVVRVTRMGLNAEVMVYYYNGTLYETKVRQVSKSITETEANDETTVNELVAKAKVEHKVDYLLNVKVFKRYGEFLLEYDVPLKPKKADKDVAQQDVIGQAQATFVTNVRRALDRGEIHEAVKEGRMSATDAVRIITQAKELQEGVMIAAYGVPFREDNPFDKRWVVPQDLIDMSMAETNADDSTRTIPCKII